MKTFFAIFFLFTVSLMADKVNIYNNKSEQSDVKIDFEKEIKSSETNTIIITVSPKNGWHINQDFPLSFKPTSSCFKFSKEKFGKKDATITENSLLLKIDTSCEKAGKTDLKGGFSFGVCSDSLCKKESFEFELSINVK
ncbi:hypothetical protein JXR93_05905 [bacterium]|nr:hypothetical protein [bacterium]